MRSYSGDTRRTRIAAIVAAALLLSGCSGSADPGGPTDDSPAATTSAATTSAAPATPSPEPKTPQPATSTAPASNIPAPKMPAVATKLSKEGFEAYVNYWFDTYNYALATGDTKPLERISHKKCRLCVDRIKAANLANANGGWIVGGNLSVVQFWSHMELTTDEMYSAAVNIKQDAARFYTADGAPSSYDPLVEKIAPFDAMAYHSEKAGWKMAIIQLVQTGSKEP